jgi:DNA-binding transcriptional MerR regulator
LNKAPEAFRTISEVAEGLDVPQHVLRFWETRFTQIRPMKRGGGRRYYRPNDVDLLNGIRQLLYGEGYTIRGVQRILRDHGVAHVTAIGRGEIRPEPEGVPGREGEAEMKPKAGDAAMPTPAPEPVPSPARAEAEPTPAAPTAAAPRAAASGPALTRSDVEELRLALTDLAAAQRILDRTE